MRAFGLLSLLVALLLVGLLARQQHAAQRGVAPAMPAASTPVGAQAAPDLREQSRQWQQQYQRALEQAVQAPAREVPAQAR